MTSGKDASNQSLGLEIAFDRPSRTYHPGEKVTGKLIVNSNGISLRHDGLVAELEGLVTLQFEDVKGATWAGGVTRTVPIIEEKRTLCTSGRLPAGATQLPFSFDLRPTVNPANNPEFTAELFETYHGVKIDVEYNVKSEIKRSLLSGGSIAQTAEVYVEFGGGGGKVDKETARRRPSEFAIVPERVRTADPGKRIPKFKIDVSATTRNPRNLILVSEISS